MYHFYDQKRIFFTLVINVQNSRKTLFPRILTSSLKLTDFTISFLQKKWPWSPSLFLKWPFLEIPPIPHFRCGSIAQNEKVKSAENFRFSINSRNFYQTTRFDTILIFEVQNGYHLHVCLSKQDSFQDSSIKHLWCLRKSPFSLNLASFSKLNQFLYKRSCSDHFLFSRIDIF